METPTALRTLRLPLDAAPEKVVDIPLPIVTSIYFFNVTNAYDVQHNKAKPSLVELGPYVYHEHHTKTKVVWNWDKNSSFI